VELMEKIKISKMGRRKFFMVSALAGLAAAFLRNALKNPKISIKRLKVSLHPAQFYKKLYSGPTGGNDAV
jgi:5-bromo-4-chloroindolyl phosphate hydrolysis protein